MNDLRAAGRAVCDRFPDAYWRDLDVRREYPEAFVAALTEAGFLAALIPREHGGPGLDLADTSDYDVERTFRETRLFQVAPTRPT